MSAAASLPTGGRRPLGELLVAHGIVTREQLTIALERQRTTGEHLGEIIVALGFAPGPIVAQALATQYGGLIKTEYGFATGWASDEPAAPAELDERDRTIAALREWAEQAQAAIASRDALIEQLRAQLAERELRAGG